MKSKKLIYLFLVPVFFAGILVFYISSPENRVDNGANVAEMREVNERMYLEPTGAGISELDMPDSFDGLPKPSAFESDKTDDLVLTDVIKDMFEFYLSTLGEVELEEVITMIQAEINSHLAEPARSEALNLLKRYVDYKIGLVDFSVQNPMSSNQYSYEELSNLQQALKDYRHNFFSGEEYDAFFAEEEQYDSFMLEQLRINADTQLSQEEKQRLLSDAEQMLPLEVQETRRKSQAHISLRDQVAELEAQGGSQTDIYNLRSSILGDEAAIALQQLDDQRQQWQSRLERFALQRDTVLVSGLSEDDQTAEINALLAANFEDHEHKRVLALMNDGRLIAD